MKKLLLSAALLASGAVASNAAVISVTSNITSNTNWINSNVYLLEDLIYVKNNAILNIAKGTLIRGDQANRGTLIITRGAQINAVGTANEPIVFTSQFAAGSRNNGDWGGIILLGNAPINPVGGSTTIEGGLTGAIADRTYGGNQPADNSGTMKFVRIEFSGIAFSPNNEINSLTMGGVGSGTTLDYIQVSYAGDDAFEWFGGTVNAKHLIAVSSIDDEFDTDFGYSGKVQFAVSQRNPAKNDVSGSNGFESDNDGTGTTATPQTNATFSNVTLIGPKQTVSQVVSSQFGRAIQIRRNSAQDVFNTVIMGYPTGVDVNGSASQNNFVNGDLKLRNIFVEGMASDFQTGTPATVIAEFNAATNDNVISSTDANTVAELVSPFSLTNPDFTLALTSPLNQDADFTSTELSDPFFETVTYRGAFGDIDWTAGWTNFDPINTNYNNASPAQSSTAPVSISPSPAVLCPGSTLTLTANVPSDDYAIQWFRGANPIAGATSTSVTVGLGGSYTVVITHPNGFTGSATQVVTISPAINPALTITSQSSFLCNGTGSVTLSATGNGAVSYEYLRNNVVIPGATGATFNATQAGNYRVRITNADGCSAITSANTVVNDYTPPSISVVRGCTDMGTVRFTASVVNNALFTYQPQFFNGSTFVNVGPAGASFVPATNGTYRFQITNQTNGCVFNSSNRVFPANNQLGAIGLLPTDSRYDYGLVGDIFRSQTVAGAVAYQFRIVNASAPSVTVATGTTTNATGAILLSNLSPNLAYGQSYIAFTRRINANGDTACYGVGRGFGTVSSAFAPSNKLLPQFCDKFNFSATGVLFANRIDAVDNYQFVAVDSATGVTAGTVNSSSRATSIASLGLTAGVTYKIAVNVTRDGNVTAAGANDTCLVAIASQGGGSKLAASTSVDASELVAYPNPFNTTTTMVFTLESQATVQVQLTDLAGRTVLATTSTVMGAGANTLTLNGETLQSGLYIARLVVNGNLAGQVRLNVVR